MGDEPKSWSGPFPSGQFTRNASGRPHATLNASPDVTCLVQSSLPVLMSNAMKESDVLAAGSEYAAPLEMETRPRLRSTTGDDQTPAPDGTQGATPCAFLRTGYGASE